VPIGAGTPRRFTGRVADGAGLPERPAADAACRSNSKTRRREARGNVLGTVPVKGLKLEDKGPFRPPLVARRRQMLGELRLSGEISDAHVRQNLQALAIGIVHQEQGGAIVRSHVAKTDVLAVAAEIGEPKRLFVKDLEEASRAAAVLNIRPFRFGLGEDRAAACVAAWPNPTDTTLRGDCPGNHAGPGLWLLAITERCLRFCRVGVRTGQFAVSW
jgi:hypothetical protein